MLLCDIGNTNYHFWDNGRRWDVPVGNDFDAIEETIYIVSVNTPAKEFLASKARVVELDDTLLNTPYEGLGIDRAMCCLAITHGVVVDAGSAITIDVMHQGSHQGGYILPGLGSLGETFATISPLLGARFSAHKKSDHCERQRYPLRSDEAMWEGPSLAVVALLEAIVRSEEIPLILTGGDASVIARRLSIDHQVKEDLVFEGMKKVIEKKGLLC